MEFLAQLDPIQRLQERQNRRLISLRHIAHTGQNTHTQDV